MTSVDYHEPCASYVPIRPEDVEGLFEHVLGEIDHHDTAAYPGVKVGLCYRAAGHDGTCEMFVDSTGIQPDEEETSHWITWEHPGRHGETATTYQWLTQPSCCPAESPARRSCVRPADHTGGHVFIAS